MKQAMLSAIAAAGLLVSGSVATAQSGSNRQAPGTPAERQSPPEAVRQGGTGANAQPGADQAGQSRQGANAQQAGNQQAGTAQPAGANVAGQSGMADQMVNRQLMQLKNDQMAGDKLFLIESALGSMFEVELSRVAQQKSQNQEVKRVAETIIRDHQQANQQLMAAAQKLNVQPPTQLTQMKQQKLEIYRGMESTMFDKGYIACMDALHAHDTTAFRHHAQDSKSQDVKQFASATLPKLVEHHQMVKQAGTALGMRDESAQPAGARIQGSGGTTSNDAAQQRQNSGQPSPGANTPEQNRQPR